jgi:hypothetical protein
MKFDVVKALAPRKRCRYRRHRFCGLAGIGNLQADHHPHRAKNHKNVSIEDKAAEARLNFENLLLTLETRLQKYLDFCKIQYSLGLSARDRTQSRRGQGGAGRLN